MQKLGQHFLKDQSILRKIAEALEAKPGELVIEIGPGHGELTAEILKTGARILAIEKDAALAQILSEKFSGGFTVVQGDALGILPEISGGKKYKLAGNIPYYITGRLMRVLSEMENRPAVSVFTMQKEVGERLCTKPPHMNRLSASVQFWADPKIFTNIPRGKFVPAPKVDSVALKLLPREREADAKKYYEIEKFLFAQPRKTVFNNLAAGWGKEMAAEVLSKSGINAKSRPQNLSVEEIIEISKNAVFST